MAYPQLKFLSAEDVHRLSKEQDRLPAAPPPWGVDFDEKFSSNNAQLSTPYASPSHQTSPPAPAVLAHRPQDALTADETVYEREQEIARLEALKICLEEQVSQAQRESAEVSHKCSEQGRRIEALVQEIQGLQQEVQGAAEVAALRDQLKEKSRQVEALELQVRSAQKVQSTLQGELDGLLRLAEEQREVMDKLEEKDGQVAEERARHEEELRALRAHIQRLEEGTVALTARLEAAAQGAGAQGGSAREAGRQLEEARARVASLEEEKREMARQLTSYVERVDGLSARIDALSAAAAAAKDLQAALDARTRERDALLEAGQAAVADYEAEQRTCEGLRGELATLAREHAREREEMLGAMRRAVRDFDKMVEKKEAWKAEAHRIAEDRKKAKAELRGARAERDRLVLQVDALVTQVRAAGLEVRAVSEIAREVGVPPSPRPGARSGLLSVEMSRANTISPSSSKADLSLEGH